MSPWWRGSKLSTIRNGHPAAPSGLQCSLAHWAYFALLRPQGARFVRPPPLPSSIRNGRPATPDGLQYSLAYWAYYGLLPPQAAAFVRPLPVSAKILRIFGRGNCKEAIFALKNGIFRRKNRPVPAVHAAGDDCTAKGLRPSRALLGIFDSLRDCERTTKISSQPHTLFVFVVIPRSARSWVHSVPTPSWRGMPDG